MKKQILITSVVIALMLLATMPTASSDVTVGGKVWSDGYVELTLNKIERVDTPPKIFRHDPPPKVGFDLVVINLTITRIEGRHVLAGERSLLCDSRGDNYTDGYFIQGLKLKGEKGEDVTTLYATYQEAVEGSEWFLIFEMPKDREPVHLRFIYNYTESWENVSIEKGEIEIDLQATSTSTPTLTPTPSPTPIPSSPTTTKIPTLEEKAVHGFEVIFAIVGLLAVAYLLRRRG